MKLARIDVEDRTLTVEIECVGTLNPGCKGGYGDPGERPHYEDATAVAVERVWEDGREIECTDALATAILDTLNTEHADRLASRLTEEL